MTVHVSREQEMDAVDSYVNHLEPMISIAERLGVTRQGVFKILRRNGVDTRNQGGIEVTCSHCGKVFKKVRFLVRKSKRHFHSQECYYAFIEKNQPGKYVDHRHGTRNARRVVRRFFTLTPGYEVHHKDRNDYHNHPENLMVFASHADHLKHHRGVNVVPLWDGAMDIKTPYQTGLFWQFGDC